MRFNTPTLLSVALSLQATVTGALAKTSKPAKHVTPRPNVIPSPYHPAAPAVTSPNRTKVCYVQSHSDGVTDDSAYIVKAIKDCNNGGHVVFMEGYEYIIGTALDLTYLNHIDLDIQGTILFTNDTDYWQANAFQQVYQNVTTFFELGGHDVNVYGGGTLNGNGQVWYDLYAENVYIYRPVLFGTIGLHSGTISNLSLIHSPQYYNFVANSTSVTFSDIFITGYSTSNNTAKNTDGWDTYRSSAITIQDSVINNGDDCVSFKPNSTDIVVQGLHCNGSHGISVGSLGQYVGEVDYVENVYVFNISMSNATDGARIKVWPANQAELSGDLQGGGGTGAVNNITYDTFAITNVDYAIEITQCYGQKNNTLCYEYPSPLTIENVIFNNFVGTASGKYTPLVGNLVCSSEGVCGNITATNIDVVGPNNTNAWTCLNVDESTLDVNCTTINKGYNKRDTTGGLASGLWAAKPEDMRLRH